MMHIINEIEFRNTLLRWWKINNREFPWRRTRDIYKILIAEILLHRTRAEQVIPVYNAFIRKFPNLKTLAQADTEDLKRIIVSLGLTWRVNLIDPMVKELMNKYGGSIPTEKGELESLPGVSQYIASAIRSFGLNIPDPILDTNTVRIIGRLFCLSVTDSSRRSKIFRRMYENLMDKNNPRAFNFAMIDLAAKLCRPVNPACDFCPVRAMCNYYQNPRNN